MSELANDYKIGYELTKSYILDIDPTTLDYEKHARYIIQRVITKGSLEDWSVIKAYYGLEFIKGEILQIRHLDPKTLNFFSTYFGIDKKNFRCYIMQKDVPQHYNYY